MALVRRCGAEKGSKSTFHCINHKGDEETVSFPRNTYGIFKIHSSCKGLLLVQSQRELFVWNPLTKFIKKVLICDALQNTRPWGIAGLCYDNLVNKYKVVVATDTLSHIHQGFLVGTCGSDKLEHCSFSTKIDKAKSGPNFRGHMHWYYFKVESSGFFHHQQIVYFDSQKNQFTELPMPQPKDGNIGLIISLGVLDGCLSLTRHTDVMNYQGCLELLVMKEYGVGNSWATMHIISDTIFYGWNGIAVPVCKRKNSGSMVCIHDFEPRGMAVCDTSGNFKVSPKYQLHVLDLVAYEECVTSPVDKLYWEEVEENFYGDGSARCSSTCPFCHTYA